MTTASSMPARHQRVAAAGGPDPRQALEPDHEQGDRAEGEERGEVGGDHRRPPKVDEHPVGDEEPADDVDRREDQGQRRRATRWSTGTRP
jgi:hypothetical protein